MFLYLPLGFSQEWSLEAEYLAMWFFGLMQLFHFVGLATTKSLNPAASQKAPQRSWGLRRHPEQLTPSWAIFPGALGTQEGITVTLTCFGVICSETKARNAFFKWRLGFLCPILGQDHFTARGCPSAEGDWSLSSCCGGEWTGRRVWLLLPGLYEQPKQCPCDEYAWVTLVLLEIWAPLSPPRRKSGLLARCWQKYSPRRHTARATACI